MPFGNTPERRTPNWLLSTGIAVVVALLEERGALHQTLDAERGAKKAPSSRL